MEKSNIIAHRGFWVTKDEENSDQAILNALFYGYGVEIDLRVFNGDVVISHDKVYNSSNYTVFNKWFVDQILSNQRNNALIILDVKEPKIYKYIDKDLLKGLNYVFVDMSLANTDNPLEEHEAYVNKFGKERVAIRLSEKESVDGYEGDYVWVDEFENNWFTMKDRIEGKKHLLVSPELHKSNINRLCDRIETMSLFDGVCTDFSRLYEYKRSII